MQLAKGPARRAARTICLGLVALLTISAAASAKVSARAQGGLFYVGAAKVDVTPTDLTGFHLGGY